jgi:hypothetical protein
VPRAVTAGADNRDIAAAGHWRYQVAQWLAARLQTTVIDLPGAHMGYLGQPEHFATALRPILDRHTRSEQARLARTRRGPSAGPDRDLRS